MPAGDIGVIMNGIVIYKSKYGSTKSYAKWIAEELGFELREHRSVSIEDLMKYDTIIYGGGIYAEVVAGVTLITKNIEKLTDKKIAVFTTAITPLDCRDYYDKMVYDKNFPKNVRDKIKVFNFLGKMIIDELSFVHKSAIKTLKKIMSSKENPTEMEKLLISLCDTDADLTDKNAIKPLIEYIKSPF